MTSFMGKTYQPLLPPVAFIFLLLCCSCQNAKVASQKTIVGQTMGTTYAIKYYDEQNRNLKLSVDSFLLVFNQSASTYIPKSTISQFNQQEQITTEDPFLLNLLEVSQKVYKETAGAFDPTVMPLVNYWRFGYEKKQEHQRVDEANKQIDSLLTLVGFDKISWNKNQVPYTIQKTKAAIELDFSAIAKGYGVDLVGELLEKKGIESYLVEIGGEMRAKGIKTNGTFWTVGIDRPIDSLKVRQKEAIVALANQSMATSGNYRNYYIKNGKKVAHTINPKTGLSELSNLLSASVFAPNCIEADAYATALMVMGLQKAKLFAKDHPDLGILLIYFDETEKQLKTWENGQTGRI